MRRKLFLLVLCLSVCVWCTACQKNVADGESSAADSALEINETENTFNGESTSNEESTSGADETSGEVKESETESEQAQSAETGEAEVQESKESGAYVREYMTQLSGQKTEESIHADVPVATAGDVIQQFEMGSTVSVDLDGDGSKEKLTVIMEGEPYYKTPVVQVDEFYFDCENMKELTRYMESADENYFYLTDLDITDGWIEIALFENGPSADPKTTFLRYSQGTLVWVGTVADGAPLGKDTYKVPLEINGDGTIICDERYDIIQTGWVIKKYVLNHALDLNAAIEEEVPEYYEFILFTEQSGWKEIITELPVYGEMKADTEQVVTLAVGTKVEFTRYYPEEGWLEIADDTGAAIGWLRLDTTGDKMTLLPVEIGRWGLYNYVDGLGFAD